MRQAEHTSKNDAICTNTQVITGTQPFIDSKYTQVRLCARYA